MTDRPIIFSAPMVRALLEGSKTQTRRILKPQPTKIDGIGRWYRMPGGGESLNCHDLRFAPDDRLWVRENWSVKRHEPCLDHERDWQSLSSPTIRYTADDSERPPTRGDKKTGFGIFHGSVEKGLPSIHMPRWASRLTLIVEGVKVERLQDISEADAIAEGITGRIEPQDSYKDLWNSINGPKAWDANPWVVAVTFRTCAINIDSMAGTA